MAFEAGRGGSGLEPKLAGLRLTPADFAGPRRVLPDAAAGTPRTSDGSWPGQAPDDSGPRHTGVASISRSSAAGGLRSDDEKRLAESKL